MLTREELSVALKFVNVPFTEDETTARLRIKLRKVKKVLEEKVMNLDLNKIVSLKTNAQTGSAPEVLEFKTVKNSGSFIKGKNNLEESSHAFNITELSKVSNNVAVKAIEKVFLNQGLSANVDKIENGSESELETELSSLLISANKKTTYASRRILKAKRSRLKSVKPKSKDSLSEIFKPVAKPRTKFFNPKLENKLSEPEISLSKPEISNRLSLPQNEADLRLEKSPPLVTKINYESEQARIKYEEQTVQSIIYDINISNSPYLENNFRQALAVTTFIKEPESSFNLVFHNNLLTEGEVDHVAKKPPDKLNKDFKKKRKEDNLSERAKVIAREIFNNPRRIAGLLATRPKHPKFVGAVCRELKKLKVDSPKLAEELQKEKFPRQIADDLAEGLTDSLEIVVLHTDLENNPEQPEKERELNKKILRSSVPAFVAAPLLLSKICPACYFKVSIEDVESMITDKQDNSKNSPMEDLTLSRLKQKSTQETIKTICQFHHINCTNSRTSS